MSGKSVPSVTAQWRTTFLMTVRNDGRRAVARRCAEGRQVDSGGTSTRKWRGGRGTANHRIFAGVTVRGGVGCRVPR